MTPHVFRRPDIGALSLAVPSLAIALLTGTGPAPSRNSAANAAVGGSEEPLIFLEVRGAPELLAERLAELGVRIRFAGKGWALIEARDPELEVIRARLPFSRVLLRVPGPVELFAVRESELTSRGRTECEPHTLLRSGAEDLRLLALPARPRGIEGAQGFLTAEHIDGAHALPLPESMSPRSLAPLSPLELANPYRRSRLADPAARAQAIALAGQVDSARILRIVRELSTGPQFTRFSCRDEVNKFAGQYLLDTLSSIFSAPGDEVIAHPFTIVCDSVATELFNVIARRPGQRPGSGRYILSAHYDATARNTPGWTYEIDPAPGADDNASGVACVIEAARILLQADYDFDLEVALFSGEELGLIGSRAYAADPLAEVEEVLGVINLDMVGYNPRAADSLNAVTNVTSEWLADLIVEAESVLADDHGLRWFDKVVQAFGRSDHAAFWEHGQSGILLIENIDIERHNPNYHRTSDTFTELASVEGGDLVRRVTEVVVATVGQFAISAAPEPSFAIPESGLLLYRLDGRRIEEPLVGQAVHVRTRVINTGAAEEGPVDVHATLRLGSLVVAQGDTTLEDWGSGVWHQVVLPWTPAPEHVGAQQLRADLILRKQGETLASLAGNASINVAALVYREAVIRPNPVRGSLTTGRLELVRLNGEADIRSRVLDALGNEVGQFEGHLVPGRPGQEVPLDRLIDGPDLPSGIYVILLDLRLPGQQVAVASEKVTFAYVR